MAKTNAEMLVSAQRKLVRLMVLIVLLGLGCATASSAQVQLVPNPNVSAAFTEPSEIAHLQINTPEGAFYVRFFGENDGPVELPLKAKRPTALLLSSELTEQGWRVHVGVQEEVFKITPLGRYDLAVGQEVSIKGLGRFGARDWSMKLVLGEIIPDAIDDGGAQTNGRAVRIDPEGLRRLEGQDALLGAALWGATEPTYRQDGTSAGTFLRFGIHEGTLKAAAEEVGYRFRIVVSEGDGGLLKLRGTLNSATGGVVEFRGDLIDGGHSGRVAVERDSRSAQPRVLSWDAGKKAADLKQ